MAFPIKPKKGDQKRSKTAKKKSKAKKAAKVMPKRGSSPIVDAMTAGVGGAAGQTAY